MKLDQHLTFKQHIMDTIKLKHNKANGLLAKMRYNVGSKVLKTIYPAILDLSFDMAANFAGRSKPKSWITLKKFKTKLTGIQYSSVQKMKNLQIKRNCNS